MLASGTTIPGSGRIHCWICSADVHAWNARSGVAFNIRFTINVASSGFCTSLFIVVMFGFLRL